MNPESTTVGTTSGTTTSIYGTDFNYQVDVAASSLDPAELLDVTVTVTSPSDPKLRQVMHILKMVRSIAAIDPLKLFTKTIPVTPVTQADPACPRRRLWIIGLPMLEWRASTVTVSCGLTGKLLTIRIGSKLSLSASLSSRFRRYTGVGSSRTSAINSGLSRDDARPERTRQPHYADEGKWNHGGPSNGGEEFLRLLELNETDDFP